MGLARKPKRYEKIPTSSSGPTARHPLTESQLSIDWYTADKDLKEMEQQGEVERLE